MYRVKWKKIIYACKYKNVLRGRNKIEYPIQENDNTKNNSQRKC